MPGVDMHGNVIGIDAEERAVRAGMRLLFGVRAEMGREGWPVDGRVGALAADVDLGARHRLVLRVFCLNVLPKVARRGGFVGAVLALIGALAGVHA